MRFPATEARSVAGRTLLIALAAGLATGAWAFDSGSTGADGELNPNANVEIVLPPSGVLNYTTINIRNGVTVTFRRNAANTPVTLLATGAVTIAGTVDVRGGDGADVGAAGDGRLADDGTPGKGGPGGFDGGAGGKAWSYPDSTKWPGGPGQGPGGGRGGLAVSRSGSCVSQRYAPIAPEGLGASYALAGANPNEYAGCGFTGIAQPYGAPAIQPAIGGSGGGGGAGTQTFSGSGGGGGGGAIVIASSGTLNVTGTIAAQGGQGGAASGSGSPARGAGGSGGAIRLVATTVSGTGSLRADGGCNKGGGCQSYTWRASPGRIRIEGDTIAFTGSSSPEASRDVPGPITIANVPNLRIDTVAGQPVPSNPTGVKDVTLAAPLQNPVAVTFTTVNIPPGNTVKLRVVPANGEPVEALSGAITGTTANGRANVSISLPNGASTMQAVTSFTVAVAMGEALSRYAANERVERIEVAATAGGPSQTTLVTTSGRRFPVPPFVLHLAGLSG